MKKFSMYTIRILAIIGAVLSFKPLYGWFEGNRSSAFNDWIMMDNSMGYNKPWDFGTTGSILGALFIIGIILILIFAVTATTEDEKKWLLKTKHCKEYPSSQCFFLIKILNLILLLSYKIISSCFFNPKKYVYQALIFVLIDEK